MDSDKLLSASYLYKRSSKTHSWKKYWVSLRTNQLSYYKDSSEHKPIKVINKSSLLSFNQIPDHQKFHFAVYTSKKVLHFRSEDQNTLNTWTHALTVFFEDQDKDIPSRHTSPKIALFHHDDQNRSDHTIRRLNSGTDFEYSGPEDALSSGLSDSPMPHEVVHSHFHLENPTIAEEDEEENTAVPSSDKDQSEYLIEQGYLLRLRKRYNQWKRFYITLTSHKLYFYKNKGSTSHPYKVIPVSEIVDAIELDPLSRSKVWCILIITPLKRLRFCAPTEEDMIRWLSALKTVIAQRRKKSK